MMISLLAAAEADDTILIVRRDTASASKIIFFDDITELFLLFCVTLSESGCILAFKL